jgi:hypothetical protein
VDPGDRDYVKMNITLTGEKAPTNYYIMFERWEYVADWVLLVFAPVDQVKHAMNVFIEDEQKQKYDIATSLEGKHGSILQGHRAIVNQGKLDVLVQARSLPDLMSLSNTSFVALQDDFVLKAGEHLPVDFEVDTAALSIGLQTSAISFYVQDADYPDCFFNQDLMIPLMIHVMLPECKGTTQVSDLQGQCICNSKSIEISGSCITYGVLETAIIV